MGNCVRSNIESDPSGVRSQYQYQPTGQTQAVFTASEQQPGEASHQHEQDEPDLASPWQQQEALVQHIADREGVCVVCVSTCSSMRVMQNEVTCRIWYIIQ